MLQTKILMVTLGSSECLHIIEGLSIKMYHKLLDTLEGKNKELFLELPSEPIYLIGLQASVHMSVQGHL